MEIQKKKKKKFNIKEILPPILLTHPLVQFDSRDFTLYLEVQFIVKKWLEKVPLYTSDPI